MKKNRSKIESLYIQDQEDRDRKDWKGLSQQERWMIIGKRDLERRRVLEKILKARKKISGKEYFYAGMVFQHGTKLSDYKKAQRLAKKAVSLNYEPAKWLYAAAVDRHLVTSKLGQKYGTQFYFVESKKEWKPFPFGEKASLEERRSLGIKPIEEQRRMLNVNTRSEKS